MYVDNSFDTFERTDLKIQTSGFQAVWLEIKNYRHPGFGDFLNYMESSLRVISDENKEVYVCGDFNIDLLKLVSKPSYLAFYNLMCSNGLIPYIVHPSRMVEGQMPSLIDNIFSNNISDFVISGNIYFNLSEHFSQFASMRRDKIDIKKIKMYGRDFLKYSLLLRICL